MQIHEIKPLHKKKNKKRIARGGKRGTTSGRGQKGQKSRAGRRIKHGEKYLIQKFPKLKGEKNKSKKEVVILHTSQLENISSDGKINKNILKDKKIIKKITDPVKILFDKPLTKSLFISNNISLSKKAKEEILKAKGNII